MGKKNYKKEEIWSVELWLQASDRNEKEKDPETFYASWKHHLLKAHYKA